MLRKYLTLALLFACLLANCATKQNSDNPKREFRGAWISTVYQDRYLKNTTEQNKQLIRDMLDRLQEAGINAVLFQARPSSDAFYKSSYEPWSRYLTKNGNAPSPYWDPLQFIIDEAHARGMELHAWLNPYRVTTAKDEKPAPGHIYHKHPERFIKYEGDGKIYFDPGLPENREFIVNVVGDIVDRYDVDGIHFDDYFYPYPANGKEFNDKASYAKYGVGQDKGDWRRANVDKLIEGVNKRIRSSKRPWVRFGISPFGIWRNKTTDPKGSDTNGLQNYDDLYADVLLWAQKGWIDYLLPQLYWELDHPKAPYRKLVEWWPTMVDPKCQLYIGQDVKRTMTAPDASPSKKPNQLEAKIKPTRTNQRIQGNCWWPAYEIIDNSNDAAIAIASSVQALPALVPAYPRLGEKGPASIADLHLSGQELVWGKPRATNKVSEPVKYVVYRLDEANPDLINDPANIYEITTSTTVPVTMPGVYTVTALDHVNIESAPVKFIKVTMK